MIGSKYTMSLNNICHMLSQNEIIENVDKNGFLTFDENEIIEIARKKLFDFNYDFYPEEEKRKALETGIIKHFYFNEIAQETYSYFKFELQHFMEINMPRYYSLFKTVPFQDQDDPTSNTNFTETYTRKNTGTSKNSGKDKNTSLSSATPQGRIDLESTNYVDNIVQNINEPNSQNETTGTEEYEYHRKGNIGVQTMAEVLEGSRLAIITVENLLYEEMDEYGLFLQIY